MDEVLSQRQRKVQAHSIVRHLYAERHRAAQTTVRHSYVEQQRAAQTPLPPVIPSPVPILEQASRLCREYTFWRGEKQGFSNRKEEEMLRYHQHPFRPIT